MKLQTTQVVGLIAVIVFGGVLAWTFTKPKPDPFRGPGAIPIGDAPSGAPATVDPIPVTAPPASPTPMTGPPPVPADPTSVGSAEAKDDLYCQGAISAAHRSASDPADAKDKRRRLMAPALASAGADRLIREGLATRETTAVFANAHADRAMADYAAGQLRISIAACEARAEAALKALERPDQ